MISRRLRFEILRRDNYTCRYCGAAAPDVPLAVDHVIPTALGGGDDPTNLVTACQDCNAGKTSTALDAATVADIDATAMLFAKAVALAADIRRAEIEDADAELDYIAGLWNGWANDRGETPPMSPGWRSTVENYLAAGLSSEDLERFVGVAMRSTATFDRKWMYFCGVCRNEVGRRHEIARTLIEHGDV